MRHGGGQRWPPRKSIARLDCLLCGEGKSDGQFVQVSMAGCGGGLPGVEVAASGLQGWRRSRQSLRPVPQQSSPGLTEAPAKRQHTS